MPRIGSVPGDGDEGYLLAFVCAAAGSEGLEAEVSTTLTLAQTDRQTEKRTA